MNWILLFKLLLWKRRNNDKFRERKKQNSGKISKIVSISLYFLFLLLFRRTRTQPHLDGCHSTLKCLRTTSKRWLILEKNDFFLFWLSVDLSHIVWHHQIPLKLIEWKWKLNWKFQKASDSSVFESKTKNEQKRRKLFSHNNSNASYMSIPHNEIGWQKRCTRHKNTHKKATTTSTRLARNISHVNWVNVMNLLAFFFFENLIGFNRKKAHFLFVRSKKNVKCEKYMLVLSSFEYL